MFVRARFNLAIFATAKIASHVVLLPAT